jgi:glycosyltransferase involved in cell wall biosynthesis
MHILLIVDDFLPNSNKVAAKMMHELALKFNNQGHFATVLTPGADQKESLVVQQVEGITTLSFKSAEIKNISKVKRAINETLLSFKAWKAIRKHIKSNKYEGIVYYSPSIFFGLIVSLLKKKYKCCSYLILRDIFPQWTVDNGLMSKKSPVYWYFKFFEWINYKSADTIGVMSPSNLNYFKTLRINTEKFEVLYNWSEISNFEPPRGKYRNQLYLEDKIVFFYGGNIGHAQQMKNLTNLAFRLKNEPKAHFLFVGKGDEVILIKQEKEKHQLSNITYLPSVDQKTFFEMLNDFDVGLFSLHPDHITHNFPGKLLGYMNYSKPILGCVNAGNDLREIINKARAGIVTQSGDEESLYQAAIQLINDLGLRKQMGTNGKKLLNKQFSVENACNQIITALNKHEASMFGTKTD